MRSKVLLAWSTGKDSAWTLHALRQDPTVQVVVLLTTVNRDMGRVAMHAVREDVLEIQAAVAGVPLRKVYIPHPCPNGAYEAAMEQAMTEARAEGVDAVAFGDLFLEDVRRYRESRLAPTGLRPIFPLWGRDTRQLAREMVAAGLRAVVTCVDPKQLDRSFAGRAFDASFLDDLPATADPCGERGEFHTLVTGGPMFAGPLAAVVGGTVERDGFVFTDVLLPLG